MFLSSKRHIMIINLMLPGLRDIFSKQLGKHIFRKLCTFQDVFLRVTQFFYTSTLIHQFLPINFSMYEVSNDCSAWFYYYNKITQLFLWTKEGSKNIFQRILQGLGWEFITASQFLKRNDLLTYLFLKVT